MKIKIEWMDQFRGWHSYQTMHHLPSAYKTAVCRSKSTGKRHRIIDENGLLLDLVDP